MPLNPENKAFVEKAQKSSEALFASNISGQGRFGSYSAMLPNWFPESYRSFNGAYDYMRFFGSNAFFNILMVLHILFLVSLINLYHKCKYKTSSYYLKHFVMYILVMLFASSYLFSFKYDYQAQGRYLFPILPFLGLFLYKLSRNNESTLVNTLFVVLFAFSVYSFVFVGLVNL